MDSFVFIINGRNVSLLSDECRRRPFPFPFRATFSSFFFDARPELNSPSPSIQEGGGGQYIKKAQTTERKKKREIRQIQFIPGMRESTTTSLSSTPRNFETLPKKKNTGRCHFFSFSLLLLLCAPSLKVINNTGRECKKKTPPKFPC